MFLFFFFYFEFSDKVVTLLVLVLPLRVCGPLPDFVLTNAAQVRSPSEGTRRDSLLDDVLHQFWKFCDWRNNISLGTTCGLTGHFDNNFL